MSKGIQWVYFDASALAKRYAQESGTRLVNELFGSLPMQRMTCLDLGMLEVVSILTRKRNDGRLDQSLFQQAMVEFGTEVIENVNFPITRNDDPVLAIDLLMKHNLNATDAVVLRSALNFQQTLQKTGEQLMLWTADKRLARAAQNENLIVFDPEVETISTLHQLLGISKQSS